MSKVKSKLTGELVLRRFEEKGIVLTDYERQHLGVLIDLVKTSERFKRENKNPRMHKEVQEKRELMVKFYPDASRRLELVNVIDELL